MTTVLKLVYSFLPKGIVNILGQSTLLKGIRNKLLRPNGQELIATEKIIWGKGTFLFNAPIRMAIKAKQKGVENTLLRSAIQLIEDKKITNPVILDVGANYGFISMALTTNLGGSARVFAFEPHPEIANAVSKSVAANKFTNITVENLAVGDYEGEIDIDLYGQTSNILQSANEGETPIKSIKIRQVSLDQYITDKGIRPDFIKIDVDGYELNVLKGLAARLSNANPF
jgi:FkbM family methyltransferase